MTANFDVPHLTPPQTDSLKEEIRVSLPASRLARHYGAKLKKVGNGWRGTCPLCGGSDTTKFSINREDRLWKCFGCGHGGDVFKLAQERDPSRRFLDIVAELAELAGINTSPMNRRQTRHHDHKRPRRPQTKPNARDVWSALATDSECGRSYLQSRGLRNWSAGVDVRFDDHQRRICVPLRDLDGTITNVVSRFYGQHHQSSKVRGLTACGTTGTFGDFRKLSETNGPVMVVEGITDWLTARQLWPDRLVLAAHGAGRVPWICEAIAPELVGQKRALIIVPDRDQAGEDAARKAIEAACKAGLSRPDMSLAILPDEGNDLNDLVTKHGGDLSKLKFQPAPEPAPLRGWSTPQEVAIQHFKAAKLQEVPTGFPLLDRALGGGMRASQTYVLAAGTGQGKTSFTLQLASQHIANGGCVAFWTMEMTPVMLQARAIAQRTGICWLDILRGEMPEETYISHVAELEPSLGFFEGRDVEVFGLGVKRLAQKNRNVLVIVDYLQKLANGSDAIREAVTEASEALRLLALELMVPLVCVSAVSREAAKRIRDAHNCHPSELVDVAKESGAIEYDAANLWALGSADGEATLSLAKNRFGNPEQVIFQFDGATGRFTEKRLVEPKAKRDLRELRARILDFFDDPLGKGGERLAKPGEPLSKHTVMQNVRGRNEAVTREIDAMVADGVLKRVANGYVPRQPEPIDQ